MKSTHLVFFYLPIIITLAETLPTDKITNEQCELYTMKIVQPLFDHIGKIQSQTKNHDNIIESKNNQITELQLKLAELQQKESENVQTIESYKEMVHSKTTHIQSLENQNKNLSATLEQLNTTCQTSQNVSDQVNELNITMTAYSETIDELKIIILEQKSQIDLDNEKMQKCENQLNEYELIAKNISDQVTELNRTIEANLETIKEQSSQITNFKLEIESDGVKMQESSNQSEKQNNVIREKDELIINLQTLKEDSVRKLNETEVQLEKCTKTSLEGKVDSCSPFGNSPGIHKIKVPGLEPFDVLCESAATGPGWIVIQQRINGKEDFYRDWATYQAGFGSFDGDFFLGLEKIYRLTSNRRHKLYIHLERFNGEFTYAVYDNFEIAGENDQYKLIHVDGFSGTATRNKMAYHKGKKFYTFDRDNWKSCAFYYHGGWWYENCAASHLNGKYFNHEVYDTTSFYWHDFYSLKKVQMLIRPKFD